MACENFQGKIGWTCDGADCSLCLPDLDSLIRFILIRVIDDNKLFEISEKFDV